MSAIIHLMGRVTKDPIMQQGKNNGTPYISLDLAASQRSQNNQNNQGNSYETVFYQCYLNQFLAERLLKAGAKKGTCIYVYGELELHPFVYNQGQKAGHAGSGAKITVRDWYFCLSNKPENESGANPTGGTMPYNGNAATPGAGGYQNQGTQGGSYQNSGTSAQGGNYPSNSNAGGNYPVGNNSGNNYPSNGNTGGSYPAGGNAAGRNYPANNGNGGGSYTTGNPGQNGTGGQSQQAENQQYGQTPPGTFYGDGFTNIPEGMAAQLPFNN